MADKPILFSGPMVRALLAGTKTQTRRVIQPQPELYHEGRWHVFGPNGGVAGVHTDDVPEEAVAFLRIAKGDRLYVREAWSGIHAFRNTPPSQRESVMTPDGPLLREDVWFWADGNPEGGDYEKPRPAMHMPRWASRLTLTVTDVRVERLLSISEADAIAEGIEDVTREVAACDPSLRFWKRYRDGGWNGYVDSAIGSYASLWTEINGPGAWEANPWVAAYTFTVHHTNIDQLEAA